jgi:hypothetical protein
MSTLTRTNILKFDTRYDRVTCNVCGEHLDYVQTDEFKPVQVQEFKGKSMHTITLKTRQAVLKNFLEIHYGRHKLAEERNKKAGR